MRVIKQSFEILPEYDDPIKQIAERSRICYKSEDKAKEDETDFVKGIIKHGHNSCLEMFVEHLLINLNELDNDIEASFLQEIESSKYLNVTLYTKNKDYLVSGSIRAFREFILTNSEWYLKFNLLHYFLNKYPILFEDVYEAIQSYEDYDEDYAEVFHLKSIKKFNLNSPEFKHTHVAVKFITNRAVTHEIVRHRPLAFLQESQRYCRYSDEKFGNEVTFIKPTAFRIEPISVHYEIWKRSMQDAEQSYMSLLHSGLSPQAARTVLPNSCKTEIIAYASLREWSHIFAMRTSSKAEPSMQEAMIPVWEKFKEMFPDIPEIQNPERSVG